MKCNICGPGEKSEKRKPRRVPSVLGVVTQCYSLDCGHAWHISMMSSIKPPPTFPDSGDTECDCRDYKRPTSN